MKILEFNEQGNLIQGMHELEWEEFVKCFGNNHRRKGMIIGLRRGLNLLKKAGCKKVYIDGSFVTTKPNPGDFDICWDEEGVDKKELKKIEPLFFVFVNKRKAQKSKFMGEFFPASLKEGKKCFVDFFQTDKYTGEPKGIVVVDLRRLS
ncbi:hypothetical protein OCO53_26165 [Peribacillus frigoritolerans]|uniref:DUF6932 family protein n=1 Tax=Peribacillus frigoritolerans TaxID=450367 RepID=UPI0021D10788|nr:hypothetical protein [Peribacillus frigoritolerans]MCU6603927.1 hypothetical protein [Peribacillus frigoritolerans]